MEEALCSIRQIEVGGNAVSVLSGSLWIGSVIAEIRRRAM